MSGYGNTPSSIPVGYETVVDMYPMDFEEFLWANGCPDNVIERMTDCLRSKTPIPDAIHESLWLQFLQYSIIGGMPAVVERFAATHQPAQTLRMQRNLLRSYEDDMLKYASQENKGFIRECFRSIPMQLSKENKKFQYSIVKKGGTASRMGGALQWIEDAGIICRCHNLHITELPLDGNAMRDIFKVYMSDNGLFTAMLEEGTQADILQGDLLGYKGAILENLMADMMHKQGRKLYYFRKDSGMEIDFVIRMGGKCVAIKTKSTHGNAKSLKTLLAHPEKYHVDQGIKLGRYNIGTTGDILTLPFYAAAFMDEVEEGLRC